jgi:hypothetical protein
MPRKRLTEHPNGGRLISYSLPWTREPDPMKCVLAVPLAARKAGNFTVTAVHPVQEATRDQPEQPRHEGNGGIPRD